MKPIPKILPIRENFFMLSSLPKSACFDNYFHIEIFIYRKSMGNRSKEQKYVETPNGKNVSLKILDYFIKLKVIISSNFNQIVVIYQLRGVIFIYNKLSFKQPRKALYDSLWYFICISSHKGVISICVSYFKGVPDYLSYFMKLS